ncbi:MAG: metal ABC transporter permease [Firmicutes bacterium]|nr:metal ABC transporter permease [Bacillota bacterium]
MLEFLSYSFARRGLLAAVAVGGTCSLLGVFVVLRGMSYLGTGIAHGSLAGVALGLLWGWNPTLTSFLAALTMAVLVEYLGRSSELRMDAAIGVVFSLALALAILLMGRIGATSTVMGYLFGNLLTVEERELLFIWGAALLVLVVIWLFFKEFAFTTFAPEAAEAAGIPTRPLSFLLTVLMSVTIVLALRAVGELLVVALMVLPAAVARQVARSLTGMVLFAVGLGVLASVLGFFLAFFLDAPSGATITLVLVGAFFLFLGGTPGRAR